MTPSTSNASFLGMSSSSVVLTLFEMLARTTWDWLGQARQLNLKFSEETVTDIAALQIAEAAGNHIKLAKTSKREEKRSGIDWMWFIGNRAQGYKRYAVQAKKITLDSSGSYSYRIRHRSYTNPVSEFQIKTLERFAIKTRAIPLYCFYNNVNPVLATKYWHCQVFPNQPDDIRQMGCTLVPLDAVQIVHKPYHRKDFTAIHQDVRSIPWRCLFHTGCAKASIDNVPAQSQSHLGGQSADVSDSVPSIEDLPEFLLGENSVVEFADVIQQLELTGLLDDVAPDSVAISSRRLAVPEWFVVIEAEPS